MRLHLPPDDLLRGKGALHVPRELCRRPFRALSAPELACSGGLAVSHVQRPLALPADQRLVDRHVAGRHHLRAIAGDNARLPRRIAPLEQLGNRSEELAQELARGFASAPVRPALLFGSVVKGQEKGWSEADLLVEIGSERPREDVWDA